ncbi:MAG: efflux RND transporter periplasmic adaptor subunit [Desulfotignum sp.]|jgi:RND family efflux transporter MFP subunit|nr:efflux RND transporter periplasmic adaptor subunit [Desulfotignum sp.]
MKTRILKCFLLFALALVIWFFPEQWQIWKKDPKNQGIQKTASWVAPVEVALIQQGPMALRRTFSGTLESEAEFLVAPKVSGRVEHLAVDMGNPVTRRQVVARLDNDEYIQAVAQAEADLAVARADLTGAENTCEIAQRELDRMETLKKRGVSSASQLDTAKAECLASEARVEMARARVVKARAVLETTRIRLGYTTVFADWTGGSDQRFMAQKFVTEGDTVSANTPMVSIVELDPLLAVLFVTEKDYGRLAIGQPADLSTDAFPGTSFVGHIIRISPVFNTQTRQARVEIQVPNPDFRLKPGMFVRVSVVLDRVEDALMVPETALVTRNHETGVFVVTPDEKKVIWQPVITGIRQQEMVQIQGDNLVGEVVILGHQMLDHGSPIRIPERADISGHTQEK